MNKMRLSVELLENHSDRKYEVTAEELERRNEKIRAALLLCDLNSKIITAVSGPVMTTFRVIPDRKMKVSELNNIASEIEYSLNINGVMVKTRSGGFDIEILNERPSIVPLKDIINSDEFRNTIFRLPLAIGADGSGNSKIIDLADAPHLLVGGSIKQGKTTALASMIISLMFAKSPEDIKFVFIDPTMMRLTYMFGNLHESYLASVDGFGEKKTVIYDTTLAANILEALCEEMDSRLNERQSRPDIVVVIDEYGDIVRPGFKSNEIMESIIRLAQHGKDAGIHLVISTGSTSDDILTSRIKATFPARVAFKMATRVDSCNILDYAGVGAEHLNNNGDILFSDGKNIERFQSPLITMEEITRIIKNIQENALQTNCDYYSLPEISNKKLKIKQMPETKDPMFDEAVEVISKLKSCSPATLQTRLAVGYIRARRILEQMEADSIVGPEDAKGKRKVLMS